MVNDACKFIVFHLLSIFVSTTRSYATYATTNTTAPLNKPDGRIVGGTEAYIFQFPYQVSIQLGGVHRCGGAVYSPTIIVSAAHCFELWDMPELFDVRAGSTEHASGGMYMAVRRIIIHAQFKVPNGIDNDIAVLALASPLPFNIYIQPIPLATRTDMVAATQAMLYISGWGATVEGSRIKAPRVRFAAVRQVEQNTCKAALAGVVSVTEAMLCAGVPGGGRDSCQGDSGGPLAGYVQGRLVLVGIVSFGVGCGRLNYPGIYTRVAEYVDWIELTASRI